MRTWVTARCPYCGTENRWREKVPAYRNWLIHWCDCEEVAGCDRPFVIEMEMDVSIIAHQIPGMGKERKA